MNFIDFDYLLKHAKTDLDFFHKERYKESDNRDIEVFVTETDSDHVVLSASNYLGSPFWKSQEIENDYVNTIKHFIIGTIILSTIITIIWFLSHSYHS